MSVVVILQALGWVSVVWLVTVHLMIQRGRLPEDSMMYRIAGCSAAGSVVAASVAEAIWPVAVLGLLWLRIEVFGHRHHVPECQTEAEAPGQHPALESGHDPAPEPERMPALLVGALGRGQSQSVSRAPAARPAAGARAPSRSPSGRAPSGQRAPAARAHPSHHLPHPHLGRRTVDRVFRVEMAIVIVVAVVLFGIWAEQQRVSFRRDSNHVVCNWIDGC